MQVYSAPVLCNITQTFRWGAIALSMRSEKYHHPPCPHVTKNLVILNLFLLFEVMYSVAVSAQDNALLRFCFSFFKPSVAD